VQGAGDTSQCSEMGVDECKGWEMRCSAQKWVLTAEYKCKGRETRYSAWKWALTSARGGRCVSARKWVLAAEGGRRVAVAVLAGLGWWWHWWVRVNDMVGL
jgi:hypothetical protein